MNSKTYVISQFDLVLINKELKKLDRLTYYHFQVNKDKKNKEMLENDRIFLSIYYLCHKIINNCQENKKNS